MAPESNSGESALVAILRGVTPERVTAIGHALYRGRHSHHRGAAQFSRSFPQYRGARRGTRCGLPDWRRHGIECRGRSSYAGRGGRLIVAPNCDVAVIECAVQLGLCSHARNCYGHRGVQRHPRRRDGAQALPGDHLRPAASAGLEGGAPDAPCRCFRSVASAPTTSLHGLRPAQTASDSDRSFFVPTTRLEDIASRAQDAGSRAT